MILRRKMIMKKKILSLALASAMALSLSTTAFAADTTTISSPEPSDGSYGASVEVTSDIKTPTISITVPGSTTVGLNPYKLEYEIDSAKYTDQIASVEQTITNASDVPVTVGATVSAKLGDNSTASLATKAVSATETKKSIFTYLEVKEKAKEDDEAAFASSYATSNTNQVVFAAKETTKTGLATLTADGGAACYAGFKVFGSMTATPTVAWNSNDTVAFTIKFTFNPQTAPAATTAPSTSD
jgi:hypothetical protein